MRVAMAGAERPVAHGDDDDDHTIPCQDVLDILLSYAMKLCLHPDQAGDLAQEAFTRVYEDALDRGAVWPGQDVFSPNFLNRCLTAVKHLHIDACRSTARHEGHQSKVAHHLETQATVSDPASDVATREEENNRARKLHEALQRLPPRQRAAIVLTYFHDMAAAEIGKFLECTAGAVHQLMKYAKERLKQLCRLDLRDEDAAGSEVEAE